MKRNNLITRLLLLMMLLGATGFSALAQSSEPLTAPTDGKDILLYETNFQDWTPMAITNGSDSHPGGGGGVGFSLQGRPNVEPTASSCGYTGTLWFNQDNNYATSPQFNFVEGGVVEIWFCSASGSERNMYVLNADAVGIEGPVASESGTFTGRYDRIGIGNSGGVTTHMAVGTSSADRNTLNTAVLGQFFPGDRFIVRGSGGLYKVSYRLPAAQFTGMRSIQFGGRDSRIVYLRVFSSLGTTPYVAATNYINLVHNPDASGHTMQGVAAGAVNSGVAVNAPVNVKGWNISGNVILSIEGPDASKFSFDEAYDGANPDGTFTIPNASALAGFNAPIQFTPSVREGIATAVLVITNPNNPSQTYRVLLTGITGDGGTTPKILANTNTIPFYTSVIAPVTLPFSLAGVNLTGPVTVSFEGPVANRFTASETTISANNAMAGRNINITFLGTTAPSEHNDMFLVLKSPGAVDVRVPLYAITRNVPQPFGEINFSVNPPGTAFLDLSLVGPRYELGTAVTVTVTPETGYEIASWSDNRGSRNPVRTFYVGLGTRNIVVDMRPIGCTNCPQPGIVDGFVAYTPPTPSITTGGFLASWSNAVGDNPTLYTVNVYADSNRTTLLTSFPAGVSNSFSVTGVAPAAPTTENDFFRWYEVVANVDPSPENPTGVETTALVGPIRLLGTLPFTCGQQ